MAKSCISKKHKNKYWAVVRRWAVDHHHMGVRDAQVKAYRLRKRLEEIEVDGEGIGDLIYHAEPYQYSDSIAGSETNLDNHEILRQYLEVRDG